MSSTLPSNVPDFETAKKPPPKERGPLGGIFITVILALALIAIIVFAVTRLSSGALSRPGPSTGPPPAQATAARVQASAAAGSPADAATQQVIQQVIQKVNDAQVQAIQTNNPDVMSATATPEFFQEQVSTNQDLVD